jgi:hypothetical protein
MAACGAAASVLAPTATVNSVGHPSTMHAHLHAGCLRKGTKELVRQLCGLSTTIATAHFK